MSAPAAASADVPARTAEARAVHGTRWVAVGSMSVGILNYVYALLLTRLLDVGDYATFAAGQGLMLCVATVAGVAVPWVLAQSLARARSDAERGDAVRFAIVTATAGGLVAGAAVGGVATRFADLKITMILAGCTLLIYVTQVTVGWLQGTERMRALALVDLTEAMLKLAAGLVLVTALGLGDAGALAAFGFAVLPFFARWPYRARGRGRRWRHVTADRDLWGRATGAAALQGLVSVTAAADIVLVTVLPADRAAAASYQAAAMLGRVPLFLAAAISMSFFPALTRSGTRELGASAIRMYGTVALPLTAVCATVPEALLNRAFPAGYTAMAR